MVIHGGADNMSELYHYGVPGQKHGNRRYQYEDGSLTPEGKIHYGVGDGKKKTSVLIKPGEKPNVIKKAVDQTKKDFKEDTKTSTKKVSRNTLFRPARSKTERQARRNLKIAAGIAGAVGAVMIGRAIVSNYKSKKAEEIKSKKFYSTVIDADSWEAMCAMKYKDIGADDQYYNSDSYRYKSKY